MPIELKISTVSGQLQATASGSIQKTYPHILDLMRENALRDRTMLFIYYVTFGRNRSCQVEIQPISQDIEVIYDTSEILSVASDTMRNRSSVPATYSTTLREDITHSVGVKWSSSEQTTEGFEIGVDFYIKGSGHMSFTATAGRESSEQKSEVVGSSRGVSVSLRPGEAVRANLVVKRRTAKIRVPFRVNVSIEAGPYNIFTYTTVGIFEIVCFTDADIETVDLYPINIVSIKEPYLLMNAEMMNAEMMNAEMMNAETVNAEMMNIT